MLICAIAGLAVWSLFALTYAKQESDTFLKLFSGLDELMRSNSLTLIAILAGWMPLAFIAQAVMRQRERRGGGPL